MRVWGSTSVNSIGLDKGNNFKNIYTTANDMMKLCKYANKNCPIINKMSKKKRIKVYDKSKKHLLYFRNTNQFYFKYHYTKKLYKIVGMKTGYTRVARNTLLTKSKAVKNGRNLLVAVFNIGKTENVIIRVLCFFSLFFFPVNVQDIFWWLWPRGSTSSHPEQRS